MNQESHIAGYPTMITETMYKPQEDYVFVNKIKAKEFVYNPNFKREPQGPFISDYYQHYEADKPQPNSLYSPIRISKENVNRQCNPFVAYPFGVPQKFEQIKCPKCHGNATFGKKKKSKKGKNKQENDLFTSSLKEENQPSMGCWSNGKPCADTNPFNSCAIHLDTKGNFKTASFKSDDHLDSHGHEKKMKNSMKEEEDSHFISEKFQTNEFTESETSNHLDKPFSHQTEECLMPSESYSIYSNSYLVDANKNTINNSTYSANHSKLYAIPNPISEGIITSNEFGSSGVPCESMQDKTSPRGKGKLYLKLNNTRINEYSNVLSSEGRSESCPTDQHSEQMRKSDDTNNKERKKVKISVNDKSERRNKEEPIIQNEKNEVPRDNIRILKKKSLKLKMNQTDIEKNNVNKQKIPTTLLSDPILVTEQEAKRSKEPVKKYKNKKSTPIRKISVSPNSARKASGETYLRMCKMQLAIDAQLKNKQLNPSSNKGMLTSEEELFGSNSSRNIYSKSRVIYRQEKKKEPKRKISKEGNINTNQSLSISPRVNPIQNASVTSDPNSIVSPNSNISINTNVSLTANISPKKRLSQNPENNQESNMNQSLVANNMKKKKIMITNKIVVKGTSKENIDTKTKKESASTSPRKTQFLKKNSKIATKNVYQKNISLARKLSSKSSNIPTDGKNITKNFVPSDANRDIIIVPKKTAKKSVSGSVKNSSISMNKALTNNNVSELSKYKNGFLKRKTPVMSMKNTQDNKKSGGMSNRGMNDIQIKKVATAPLKKKKTIIEEPKKIGSKNAVPQTKEDIQKKIGSVSDSALVNESEEIIPKMEVKFGRSETKLYMPNHKIVPFKKTEVKMVTKKDSGKMKTKTNGRVNRSDTTTQRKVKEVAKTKKNSAATNIQSSFLNKNVKGTLKNKKKELFDNIMLLSKTMAKKSDIEEKTIKNPENKNYEEESDFGSEILNSKLKRVQTIKDKKREVVKKDKKEKESTTSRNLKKKEKTIEKKEKKGDEQE